MDKNGETNVCREIEKSECGCGSDCTCVPLVLGLFIVQQRHLLADTWNYTCDLVQGGCVLQPCVLVYVTDEVIKD